MVIISILLQEEQDWGKFYLRSAPTGVGKTRSMIADACNIAAFMTIWDGFNSCLLEQSRIKMKFKL